MKNIFCVAMLFCISSFCFGQIDEFDLEHFDEDYYTSIKDIRELEKFRIGVDVSTPTVGSLAGVNLRPRASLIFNLKTAPNRAWRFVPAFERNRRFSSFETSTYNPIAVNDSSLVLRNEFQEEYRLTARIGTEWFKQYSKNSMVYGVDLVLGYYSEYESYLNSYRLINEDGSLDPLSVNRGFFTDDDLFNREIFRTLIGIDFSIGYKIFLSPKADLTFEWIPEISYRPFFKSVEFGQLPLELLVPEDEFIFDIRQISLQLHYKFLKQKA